MTRKFLFGYNGVSGDGNMWPYTLEEQFYTNEQGFDFQVKTGLDLTDLQDGEIVGVVLRPNGSTVTRTINIARIVGAATDGVILFPIQSGDLTQPGNYRAQIFIRDADLGRARPSHPWEFKVVNGLVANPSSLFA